MSETYTYTIRRVRRAKRMRIIIHHDGSVVVTKPWWARTKTARAFLEKHHDWVLETVRTITSSVDTDLVVSDPQHYTKHKEDARSLVLKKLKEWNAHYGFTYGRVSIRNQKTRWGSCSSEGNLNFSYKILFLPEHLQDYLVVHELCHLKEMNHSPRFWKLVEQTIPTYRSDRKELNGKGGRVD